MESELVPEPVTVAVPDAVAEAVPAEATTVVLKLLVLVGVGVSKSSISKAPEKARLLPSKNPRGAPEVVVGTTRLGAGTSLSSSFRRSSLIWFLFHLVVFLRETFLEILFKKLDKKSFIKNSVSICKLSTYNRTLGENYSYSTPYMKVIVGITD
jgi:hypothetical protein